MGSLIFFILLIILLVIIFPKVEADSGRPFAERVTVQSRKFVPRHASFNGKVLVMVPDIWLFEVESEKIKGKVTVSQELYDSTAEGDSITVTGTRGAVSKKWYLEAARKEP